ncbi:MAG TPA: FecR domain-containing protein [Steroidobacter sp.]|uniref:FecR family protein n=1 Tax=Steroidobacter sp. TaxID=1978227 RepID=UPI002ED83CED
MNRIGPQEAPAQPTEVHLEQATQWFLRLRERGQVEDLPGLQTWIDNDPLNKVAYQRVAATWSALGQFSVAPEVMVGRRNALDSARRAARRRWSAQRGSLSRYLAIAASLVIAVIGTLGWWYSQRGVFNTGVAERRALTLEDGSVVTLDANSRVRVQYERDQRLVSLERGQARFDVAKDPTRPFRVSAQDQTVVALGTQFNVELLGGNVLVSMIEGRVAITGVDSTVEASTASITGAKKKTPGAPGGAAVIELKAGEGLRVRGDGQGLVLPKIDVDRATAWQAGKMFFDNEPLASAAERVNRYSQLQIVVDPAIANVSVSGAFNTGDPNAFVEAIATYFPVQVDRTSESKIRLTSRD